MHVASVTTYDKFLEVDSAVQNMNLGFHPHLCLISTSHIPQPPSGTFGISCQIPLLSFPAFSGQQGEAPRLTYRGLSTKQYDCGYSSNPGMWREGAPPDLAVLPPAWMTAIPTVMFCLVESPLYVSPGASP